MPSSCSTPWPDAGCVLLTNILELVTVHVEQQSVRWHRGCGAASNPTKCTAASAGEAAAADLGGTSSAPSCVPWQPSVGGLTTIQLGLRFMVLVWHLGGTWELMHAKRHAEAYRILDARICCACTCWPHAASGPLHGLSRLCSYQEAGRVPAADGLLFFQAGTCQQNCAAVAPQASLCTYTCTFIAC